MKQGQVHVFSSECGRVIINVDKDMPIGVFHDFLMEIKGLMVDRMVIAHQEQLQQAQAMKSQPPHESEISAVLDQAQVDCAQEE